VLAAASFRIRYNCLPKLLGMKSLALSLTVTVS